MSTGLESVQMYILDITSNRNAFSIELFVMRESRRFSRNANWGSILW